MEWIAQQDAGVSLVVFPEYSFPVNLLLDDLIECARRHKLIIVAGADSELADTLEVFNQSPVILPTGQVHWVPKRSPSQWEGFLTTPPEAPLKRFVWQTPSGVLHWFSVYVCLDYLDRSMQDVHDNRLAGPGLFLAPMFSPTTVDFHVFATAHFRRHGGTATVLCNCVSADAAATSAICTVGPSRRPQEPTLSLPAGRESLAIATIDMGQLAPARVTTTDTRSALSDVRLMTLAYSDDGGLAVSHVDQGDHAGVRGIVNPELFRLAGHTMRMAFLEVTKYATVRDNVKQQQFETLAVLGHCDLIITHVHQSPSDMVFDIHSNAGIVRRNGNSPRAPGEMRIDEIHGDHDGIPHFEVERFYKVLGHRLHAKRIDQVPEPEDLVTIVSLGADWYDPAVSEEARNKATARRWVLGKTRLRPGEISAIVTVSLGNRTDSFQRRLRDFEQRVLQGLVEDPAVTSCLGGTGHAMDCDFVLRTTTDADELFTFVEGIHSKAEAAKELILTRTYVVASKLSALALEGVLLSQPLPPNLKTYAAEFFLPGLEAQERLRFTTLGREKQEELLGAFKLVVQAAHDIPDMAERGNAAAWTRERLRRHLASGSLGFFYSSGTKTERDAAFTQLKELHDFLQMKVETLLANWIRGHVDDSELPSLREDQKIQPHKPLRDFGYLDRIKAASGLAKMEGRATPAMAAVIDALFETNQYRNAITHPKDDEFEKFSLQSYAETLRAYIRFLAKVVV